MPNVPAVTDELTYVRARERDRGAPCEVHDKSDADVGEAVLDLLWMRRYGGRLTVCRDCVERSGSDELKRLWEQPDFVPLPAFNDGDESGWAVDT